MKNIHIGYGDSATGCILEAIKIHSLSGDEAIPSRDDFTQGPISDCLLPNGLEQRIEYWESVDKVLRHRFDVRDFYHQSIKILDDLVADEITLWVGDSCHDILATGWLVSYLENKNFNWFYVNLADVNAHYMPRGLPVVNLAMYVPKDLPKLYKYRKPLSSDDKVYYKSIWNKVATENSHYRIKKDGEIISIDEDYYDEYILSHIPEQFESTSKIIGIILRDGAYRISDTTVEWNIKKMVDRELIDFDEKINFNSKRI